MNDQTPNMGGITTADVIAAAGRMSKALRDASASSTDLMPALAADPPKVRMCPDCRDGKHHCAGFAFDANDKEVPCPCLTCHPPAPERCGSCNAFINPDTGECRCSD